MFESTATMTSERPLRGRCLCSRNQYIIQRPKDAVEVAQVFFDTNPMYREYL